MVIAVVLLIAVLTFFALTQAPYLTRRDREKALDGYVREANLPLTPDVRPAVVRRIVARERSAVIGCIGCGALGFLIFLLLPDAVQRYFQPSGTLTSLLFAVFGLLLGSSIAPVAIGVSLSARPRTGPRIARATTPKLSDYVPRFELWTATMMVAAVAVVLALGLATIHPGEQELRTTLHFSFGALYAYVAISTYVFGKVVSHRIIRTSQAAASEKELAWDDALRASTLRNLTRQPVFPAVMALSLLMLDITSAADIPQGQALLLWCATAGIAFAVLLAIGIVELGTQPKEHYWRRLWAEQQAAR